MKKENVVKFIGFKDALKNFFAKYTDYKGTATRAEYWWIQLFFLLVTICACLCFVLGFVVSTLFYIGMVIYVIFMISTIIPRIMLTIRRMHDIGLSGWWYFCMGFICAILSKIASVTYANNEGGAGSLIAFALCLTVINVALLCSPSVCENNKYRK